MRNIFFKILYLRYKMSALTYLEKFNFYLKSFIDELIAVYPEYKDNLEQEYNILFT